jgi:hypothetical protein
MKIFFIKLVYNRDETLTISPGWKLGKSKEITINDNRIVRINLPFECSSMSEKVILFLIDTECKSSHFLNFLVGLKYNSTYLC